MNIGTRLRQLRLERGLSQENLADALGLSTTAYGDIERNKTDLTLSRLLRIAQVLQVDLAVLLDDPLLLPHAGQLAEVEKLKLEVERWQIEAAYWKEKATQPKEALVLVLQPEAERRPIGFTAS